MNASSCQRHPRLAAPGVRSSRRKEALPSGRLAVRIRASAPSGFLSAARLCLFLCLALLLLARPVVGADDPTAVFDRANALYEQGKFSEAAAAYEKILQAGRASSALYFNLGNALFKSGQLGRAIVNYRLAQRLAPRDPDIQANLQFARGSVVGAGLRKEARWARWLRLATLNEVTGITVCAVWVWLGFLTAGLRWPSWKRSLRTYTTAAGAGVGLLAMWLGVVVYERSRSATAVVIARDAVVRYGPLEESQSAYTARDGLELAVLDEKNGWLQVADHNKRLGWLEAKQLVVLPSELSAPARPLDVKRPRGLPLR